MKSEINSDDVGASSEQITKSNSIEAHIQCKSSKSSTIVQIKTSSLTKRKSIDSSSNCKCIKKSIDSMILRNQSKCQ